MRLRNKYFTSLIFFTMFIFLNILKSYSEIVYVPSDYDNIKDALDYVNSLQNGSAVWVDQPGYYYEDDNLIVGHSSILYLTPIYGGVRIYLPPGKGLSVYGTFVSEPQGNLNYLDVSGLPGKFHRLSVYQNANIRIRNLSITNANYGMYFVYNSTVELLENVNISNCDIGVFFKYCNNSIYTDDGPYILNSRDIGILFDYSDARIENWTVWNGGTGIFTRNGSVSAIYHCSVRYNNNGLYSESLACPFLARWIDESYHGGYNGFVQNNPYELYANNGSIVAGTYEPGKVGYCGSWNSFEPFDWSYAARSQNNASLAATHNWWGKPYIDEDGWSWQFQRLDTSYLSYYDYMNVKPDNIPKRAVGNMTYSWDTIIEELKNDIKMKSNSIESISSLFRLYSIDQAFDPENFNFIDFINTIKTGHPALIKRIEEFKIIFTTEKGDFEKSIVKTKEFINKYQDYASVPTMLANLVDLQLSAHNDKKEAEKYYDILKEKYPNDINTKIASIFLLTYNEKSLQRESIVQSIPKIFKLHQNYPNPFNPSTLIRYELPNATHVQINVYNITGKLLKTLVNEKKGAGEYSVTFDATEYPSGIYFYKIFTYDYIETNKMILIK